MVTNRQRHKPRAHQSQRHIQSMFNTLQVDGLAHIPGYDKDHICRILSHRTASPHALFDVLVLDGGMNDLVKRDRELSANKRDLTHVPDSGEFWILYHHIFSKTGTSSIHSKSGMGL